MDVIKGRPFQSERQKPSPNRIDISGHRYGELTATSFVGKDRHGFTLWKCVCDCGAGRVVSLNALRTNKIKQCSRCVRKNKQRRDLTGLRFGKLTVRSFVKHPKVAGYGWFCDCDCGRHTVAVARHLVTGAVVTCGCGRVDRGRNSLKPIIGLKFGRLQVLSAAGREKGGQLTYLCRCECGARRVIRGRMLRSGGAVSCGCSRRLVIGESAFNSVFKSYRVSARERGHAFSLTKEQFLDLVKGNCRYCGLEPRQRRWGKTMYGQAIYNGIDRVDNTLGYVDGNCVSCCRQCNVAKSRYTLEEFTNWVQRCYQILTNPARFPQ